MRYKREDVVVGAVAGLLLGFALNDGMAIPWRILDVIISAAVFSIALVPWKVQ